MGTLTDPFWYYSGTGWALTVPTFGVVGIDSPYYDTLFFLGFGATLLMTCLCLYYRPEKPKRVALFGLLTILGTTVLGVLTGTEGVRALVPTLAKWVVAMLFAAAVVRFRIDKKLRAAIPHRS
ncbi:hypothetical protein [Haladaptatus sp. T7]|uniref:hypothetical protein n=1 Tax=Haladaptatus sp. T7 TaxID=2029368 RepID=UPI0021A25ACF|nr:hypothetical protein [Haladaptatus sp. T7]GKZ15124.1 hypothetical protein HAL_30050 [Haladaptatus sp. T7]